MRYRFPTDVPGLWRYVAIVAFASTAYMGAFTPGARAAPEGDKGGEAAEGEERICRTMPTTGWRTAAVRICRTRAEWVQWARENRVDVSEVLRRRGRPGS